MRSRMSTCLVKHAGSRSQPPLPSCRHSLDFMVCLQQRKKKNNSSMGQKLAMPKAPSLALISNPRPLSRAVYFPVINPPKVRVLSIECTRVGRVEIPNNKRIEFSLQYIHGIGRSRARKILYDISMDNKVTKDLSEEDLITLRDEVSKYVIEGDLRRFNALNIRRLKEIQCYRG
ncbi:small ribosomal subunit protein uS13c-like [Arachis hypogaea]|uniref:small ribosomal subunit protein uS13c-like n=1 Tax=Arachis hypogaea TaxID=3818 RepID=UPI003B0B813C